MSNNNQKQDSKLGKLIKMYMIKQNIWFTGLEAKTGIPRATLIRYSELKTMPAEPKLKHIQILISTFRLDQKESEAFLDAAYPGWSVWQDAVRDKCSLDDANKRLHDKDLPLLITTRDKDDDNE